MARTHRMMARHGTYDLRAIDAGGEYRILASWPTSPMLKSAFPPFSSAYPVIPRDEWKPIDLTREDVPILDQNGHGSCVGQGATTAMMLARSIAGMVFTMLSAPFVYSQINGGRDNGSIPGDAAKLIQDVGICLFDEFPEPNYQPSKVPKSAFQTAKRFRAIEVYRCDDFDQGVSAFMQGFTPFDTVMVGGNFNSLNSDGCPPISRGPGNHCIAFGEVLKKAKNGDWIMQRRNSWSTRWGVNGRYFQTEAHCKAQGQWYECWAVKSVADDPNDPTNPPPI